MSRDDLLDRATAALRASGTAATPTESGRTRARVLLAASARTKRRNVVSLILPIAAVLTLGAAWAGTHGSASRWPSIARYFGGANDTTAARGSGAATGVGTFDARAAMPAAPSANAQVEAPPNVAWEAPIAPVAPVASAALTCSHASDAARRDAHRPPTSRASATGAPAASASAAAASDVLAPDARIDALYAAAHRAHFVDRDPSAALRAWDAYLDAAPDGAFAPEARYNRALALVRLGRLDEARRALAVFASDPRGYRSHEASRLLDALGTR